MQPWTKATLRPTNSFLRGRTLTNRDTLIYCTSNLELTPSRALNTFQYIVGRDTRPLNQYDAIEFTGGSLNSVFAQKSLESDFPKNGGITLKVKSDEICISLEDAKLESMSVFSEVQGEHTDKGNSIKNTGAKLRLLFKEPQDIENTVVKQYSDVLALVQFMTFRKDVFFGKVTFLKHSSTPNGDPYLSEIADCFIKEDWPDGHPRDRMRCITFNELGPATTGRLYKEIKTRDTKNSRFSVSFIPDSNRESHWLKAQQVRDICTSIELEASLWNIFPSNSSGFSKAVGQMRDIIDAIMDSDEPLTKREYDYLRGSIRHMNGLADKMAKVLFDRSKPSLSHFLTLISKDDLTEEEIQILIKARNELTHAGVIQMSDKLADVALVMMGVVYSSILSRCGCSSETISHFFANGLLTA